jgi:two-component system phosphate regulon sensor histidine kinase PhoR
VVVFTASYFLFNYLLQQFIYQKIKVIYKNIYRTKTQSAMFKGGRRVKDSDPIEEVSKEVISWMRDNRLEIDRLKEQAGFRREFLGNVGHELKTPIQSIQGYIHTLLDGALEDEKVNRLFLEKAGKGVDRLVELVDDLTSINDFETKGINLEYETFDLAELADEVFDIVRQKGEDKKITFGFKKLSEKTFNVNADRNRIRQVLINLLVNAVKYGKKNGEVRVGFYDIDQNVLVEVTDDGIGIEEEHLPRLFERFYRTDSGRSRDRGGSGLGLSIVKHIIEAHDQTVNVRSTLGKGSTFGFTLQKS